MHDLEGEISEVEGAQVTESEVGHCSSKQDHRICGIAGSCMICLTFEISLLVQKPTPTPIRTISERHIRHDSASHSMVHLFELPAEIFDHIIAAIFDAENGYPLALNNTEFHKLQTYRCSADLLELRTVHSRFRVTVDPHLFRLLRLGGLRAEVVLEDESPSASFKSALGHTVIGHVKILCLRTTTLLEGDELEPEDVDEDRFFKVADFVEVTSSRLETLIFGQFRDDTNVWYVLEQTSFASLRSLCIHDPAFAFCLPQIAYSAPLLHCGSLEGFGNRYSFDDMQQTAEEVGLAEYVTAYPMRPFERLIISEPEKPWLLYLLSIMQPQASHVILEFDDSELDLEGTSQCIRYLGDEDPTFHVIEFRETRNSVAAADEYAAGLRARKTLVGKRKEMWKGRKIRIVSQKPGEKWSGEVEDLHEVVDYS